MLLPFRLRWHVVISKEKSLALFFTGFKIQNKYVKQRMVHLEYSHVISVGILILANRFSKGSEIIPTFSF